MICIYWPAAGSDSSGFWLHEISVELWKVISCRFAVVQPVAQTKFLQLSRGGAVMTDVSWVTWAKNHEWLSAQRHVRKEEIGLCFFEIFRSWICYSDSSGESLKIFEPTLKLQCILRMVSIGRWSPLCQWNTRNMCREENFTKQQASTLTVSSQRSQPSDSSILRSPKNLNKVCRQPTISPGGF